MCVQDAPEKPQEAHRGHETVRTSPSMGVTGKRLRIALRPDTEPFREQAPVPFVPGMVAVKVVGYVVKRMLNHKWAVAYVSRGRGRAESQKSCWPALFAARAPN